MYHASYLSSSRSSRGAYNRPYSRSCTIHSLRLVNPDEILLSGTLLTFP